MSTTTNRRAQPRIPFNTVLGIQAEGRVGRAGMTRNISNGGLIFHSASRFAPGERLELKLQPPDSVELRRVKARVVHTRIEPPELGTLFKHVTAVEFEDSWRAATRPAAAD